MKKFVVLLSFVTALLTATSADAKHRRHARHVIKPECVFMCVPSARGLQVVHQMGGLGSPVMKPIFEQPAPRVRATRRHRHREVSNYGAPTPNLAYTVAQILPHPSGCPSRAFCGCGASIEAFGRNVRSLWLASNWYRFPRATPAPGMAIVRPHHVAILKSHVQGSVWMVVDHNGGGHRSWLHARSISGYTVVNPHG